MYLYKLLIINSEKFIWVFLLNYKTTVPQKVMAILSNFLSNLKSQIAKTYSIKT